MLNIYKIQAGAATPITIDEALVLQRHDDYGYDVITAYCETAEQALALAERYDAGGISYDTIAGDEAIRHGLVGLS